MEKLSVTIITKNEEKNIARCLESVKWADEIIVLDTSSTDRTVEICRQYTDQIFCVDWHGYGKQKNLCADRTSHNWVLNIDSDEEISAEGAEEIRAVLREGSSLVFLSLDKAGWGRITSSGTSDNVDRPQTLILR